MSIFCVADFTKLDQYSSAARGIFPDFIRIFWDFISCNHAKNLFF